MDRLNAGLLPPDYFAMAEQIVGRPEPDVVTLQTRPTPGAAPRPGGAVEVAPTRPKTAFVIPIEMEIYARKANQVVVRHELGQVVAVIEIMSPGNKDSRHAIRDFVRKAIELIRQGIHLLIIDPFPPG